MRFHVPDDSEACPAPAGWALKLWCLCSQVFVGQGRTVRAAADVAWGKAHDHVGLAVAAGRGTNGGDL